MNIKTRKLGHSKWEMHLEPPGYIGTLNVTTEIVQEELRHDCDVKILHDALTTSEWTMWSRQAYDRWHWYDQDEMNKFIIHFLLKNLK